MKKIDDYLAAATRENTRRSYLTAIRHFEVEWGGFLPATADSIARYLADHAEVLAITTLRQRLAALAQWHVTQGFPDPTKAPVVRKVLKGIQALHPAQEKQATPLQIDLLTCQTAFKRDPRSASKRDPLFGYDAGLLKMALRCVRRRAGVARPEARAAQDRFLKAPKVAVSCGF